MATQTEGTMKRKKKKLSLLQKLAFNSVIVYKSSGQVVAPHHVRMGVKGP